MGWAKYGYVASAAVHIAVFGGLNIMKKPDPASRNVAVMMSQAKKKDKPKPPEPPKPIEAPKETLQRPLAARKAAPPPVAAPPPDPIAAAHPQLAAMPDFGINLSGGGLAAGGIAIPMGGGARAADKPVERKEKVLGASAHAAVVAADGCDEEIVKAKAQSHVQPAYSDDARAAGIEGRVRVEVTLDESGAVVSARVLTGLGHGLDEAAIIAAKHTAFSVATRCGAPVKSTFTISYRFALSD